MIKLPKVLADKLKLTHQGKKEEEEEVGKYLNNLKLNVTALEVFEMNLREENVQKAGHRRTLNTYRRKSINAFEI